MLFQLLSSKKQASMREVKFKKFRNKPSRPRSATVCFAGYDLLSAEKIKITARSEGRISTGIGIKIDWKLVGKICSRSSLSMKQLEVGAGTIGNGYRGMVYIVLHNLAHKFVSFNVGDKLLKSYFNTFHCLF